MTRHNLRDWDVRSDDAETTPSIDTLIRPGLRRAFPLPPDDHASDSRFRLLLDALAQRRTAAEP